MSLVPRLGRTSSSEARHSEASLLSLSPLPDETFFKNYRKKVVYPRALVLGTQADGTGISGSADTEGSKHNQLKPARTSPHPAKCGEQRCEPFPGSLLLPLCPPDPGMVPARGPERGLRAQGSQEEEKSDGSCQLPPRRGRDSCCPLVHSLLPRAGWGLTAQPGMTFPSCPSLCIKIQVGPGDTSGQRNVGGNDMDPSALSWLMLIIR